MEKQLQWEKKTETKMVERRGKDHYYYVHSCDLRQRVKLRIGSLQGKLPEADFKLLLRDELQPFLTEQLVHVSLEVYDDGIALSLPVFTRPISIQSIHSRNQLNWNQWLELPVEYCELSREALIAVRLIDTTTGDTIGGSVMSLFSETGEFHHGAKDICLWPGRAPDPVYYGSSTPAIGKQDSSHQMPRLQPLVDDYNRQQLSKVDWLDKLVFREIEQINEQEKQDGYLLHLLVETERIKHVTKEIEYNLIYLESGADEKVVKNVNPAIRRIVDIVESENLVENAQLRMARSIGRSMIEKKPTPKQRDQLNKIIQTGLKHEDKELGSLVFRFRNYLSSDMAALIPFLTLVRWSNPDERNDALDMLLEWTSIL